MKGNLAILSWSLCKQKPCIAGRKNGFLENKFNNINSTYREPEKLKVKRTLEKKQEGAI